MSGEGSALAACDPMQAARRAFGKALASWRNDKGLTPLQAARHLGLTHDYYLRAETGRMHPGDVAPSTALRMISASGLTAEQLGLAPKTDDDPPPTAAVSPGPDAVDGGDGARRAGRAGPARAVGLSPTPGAGLPQPSRRTSLAFGAPRPSMPVPANLLSDIVVPEVRLIPNAAGDMVQLIAPAPSMLLEPCAARLLAAALKRHADLAEA